MEQQKFKTEAESGAEIALRYAEPKTVVLERGDGGRAEVLVVPVGHQVHPIKPFLDPYRERPERRKGSAQLLSLASFVEHTKRFADKHSVIFADPSPKSPSLTAVLDYHEQSAVGAPRWGEHRGIYAFPLSDEWTVWQANNERAFSQADFAAFLEDHIADLADPGAAGVGPAGAQLAITLGCDLAAPARILETSRNLSVRVNSRVQQAVNLATGEVQFAFTETHSGEGGGPVRVPGAFLLAIPVFRGEELFQVAVRLRYRVKDGTVTWNYSLYRADRVFTTAFDEACKLAAEETGLPLLLGMPER